jgi:glycosyltransferase involved in cell wall biosynthesis
LTPRIVFFANSLWNIHHFRRPFIDECLNKGWEVIVMVPENAVTDPIKGVQYALLSLFDPEAHSPFQLVKELGEAGKMLKRISPDVVVSFTPKANLIASWLGLRSKWKTMNVITGLGWLFTDTPWPYGFFRSLFLKVVSRGDKVVVQNRADHDLFTQNGASVTLIHGSGVDTERFRPLHDRDQDLIALSFVGRCIFEKGIGDIMHLADKAEKEYEPLTFHIVGRYEEGNSRYPAKEDWDRFLSDPAVTYHGEVEDVRMILNNTDILVLPSHREGLSMAIQEAMSMGLPVIATRVPGCEDLVVHGETGWLVEKGNQEELWQTVKTAVKQEYHVLKAMGARGRQRMIDMCERKKVALQYLKVLEEVLERK